LPFFTTPLSTAISHASPPAVPDGTDVAFNCDTSALRGTLGDGLEQCRVCVINRSFPVGIALRPRATCVTTGDGCSGTGIVLSPLRGHAVRREVRDGHMPPPIKGSRHIASLDASRLAQPSRSTKARNAKQQRLLQCPSLQGEIRRGSEVEAL